MSRNLLLAGTVTLVTEVCCNCHVVFAIPMDMQDRRRADHKLFYCPSGHGQHYNGKSETEKLREQLERVERQRNWAQGREARLRDDLEHERRSAAAYRGHLTRIRNRIAAGVCPCCRRHFTNVERHIAGEHPDFAPRVAEALATTTSSSTKEG